MLLRNLRKHQSYNQAKINLGTCLGPFLESVDTQMKGLPSTTGRGFRTCPKHCTPVPVGALASTRALAEGSVGRRPQKERPGRHGGGLSGIKAPGGSIQKQGQTISLDVDSAKVRQYPKRSSTGTSLPPAARDIGSGRSSDAHPAGRDWGFAGSAPKKENFRRREAGPVAEELDWDGDGSVAGPSIASQTAPRGQEAQGTTENRGGILEPGWMSWGPSIPQQTGRTSGATPSQGREGGSQAEARPGSRGGAFEGLGSPRERGSGGLQLGSDRQHSRGQARGNSWGPSGVLANTRQAQQQGRPNWGTRDRGSREGPIPREERVRCLLANNAAIEGAYQRTLDVLREFESGDSGEVPAAKQTILLQDFVAELADVLHSSQAAKVSRFDPVSISTALHHLAACLTHSSVTPAVREAVNYQGLVEELLDAASTQVKQFKMTSVYSVVWGMARLGYPVDDELLDALCGRALTRLNEPPAVEGKYVCGLLWACAKLGKRPLGSQLFDAGIRASRPQLDTFSLQHISNLVWALATVQHSVETDFLHDVMRAALPQLFSGDSQGVSSLLWALARLNYNPQMSRGGPDVEFFNTAAEVLLQDVETQPPQSLSNAVWAFARLRINPKEGKLVSGVVAAAAADPGRFTIQQLSMIALAAGILQAPVSQEEVQPFIDAMLERTTASSAQEICNLCWSLAALDRLSPETLTKLTTRLETLGALEGLTDAQSQQLLLAEEQCPDALPRAVHLKAWRVANERVMPSIISSFQDEVGDLLKSMGIRHSVERPTPDGLLCIDLLVPRPGRTPVALEVDGPLHFTALPPYTPLGHTALRNRLLQQRGFVFLGVPSHVWMTLRAPEAKREFLKARLVEAGVDLPPIDPRI